MPLVRRAGTAFRIDGSVGHVELGTGADEAAPGSQVPGPWPVDTTGATAGQTLGFTGAAFTPVDRDSVSLQGYPVSEDAPAAEGARLAWDGAAWAPTGDVVARVQTTDATPTTIASYTIPADGTVVQLAVRVVARKTDGTARQSWVYEGFYERAAGAAAEVDTPVQVAAHTSGAVWSIALDTSGAAVRVRATGQAATTIDWTAHIAPGPVAP